MICEASTWRAIADEGAISQQRADIAAEAAISARARRVSGSAIAISTATLAGHGDEVKMARQPNVICGRRPARSASAPPS